MDRDEVEVHKLAKKRTRPISSHLDRTNLVNKGFIIWLLGKFCLRDTAGSPERARWLHLARSGSQSQRAIWFILPARGTSDIIRFVLRRDPKVNEVYCRLFQECELKFTAQVKTHELTLKVFYCFCRNQAYDKHVKRRSQSTENK